MVEFVRVDEWEAEEKDKFLKPNGASIIIEFDKILKGVTNLFNSFVIKKDSYIKRLDEICKYVNYFIKFYDADKKLLWGYGSVNKIILDQGSKKLNLNACIDLVYKLLIDDTTIDNISRMVEDNYYINVENTDPNVKYTESLEFTNEHVKLMMKISIAMKIMTPVMFNFINLNYDNIDYNMLFRFYQRLFYIFDTNIDIYTKLYNTVLSRVNTAKAYNPIIFKQHEAFGITVNTLTDKLLKVYIIGESMWRYIFCENPINLNSVIINKQIKYFRITKHLFNLVEVDTEVHQESGLSGFDKLEMNSPHLDESKSILSDINIATTMERLKKSMAITVTEDEINYYMKNHTPTDFQRDVLNHYYAKDFGGFYDSYLISKVQYYTLLILLKRRMQFEGAKYLPQLMTGNFIGTKLNTRTIQDNKFLSQNETTEIYKDLMKDKFYYVNQIMETDTKGNKDPLKSMMSVFIVNTFTWCDYDDQEHFGQAIEIDKYKFADEFNNFAKHF